MHLKRIAPPRLAEIRTTARWALWRTGLRLPRRRHGLPYRLVVSLTSYPPRYPTLALTLKCLLAQTVRADQTVLWIAREHMAALPANVTRLQAHGLAIRQCEDLRSFKKLVPQVRDDPEAAVVTVDDDLYLPPSWLAELVDAVRPGAREVLAHRAHRVTYDAVARRPRPYAKWNRDTALDETSRFLFPTSGGGVLYMPGTLDPAVTDAAAFQRCCPTGDDIWYFFMAARTGTLARKISRRSAGLTTWQGSQAAALWQENRGPAGAYDGMIAAMIERYGDPWREA